MSEKHTFRKIDEFFETPEVKESLENACSKLEDTLDDLSSVFIDSLKDYIFDEYQIFIHDCIQSEARKTVINLLKGDLAELSNFYLAPSSWGVRNDHYGIRKRIIEQNKDTIKDTHIEKLEQDNKRLLESLRMVQDYGRY